jgi:arginine:ornithine antiporter / lysine permease
LLSAILYAPGTLLFFLAKREREETAFKSVAALFAALAIAACAGIYALAVGTISI